MKGRTLAEKNTLKLTTLIEEETLKGRTLTEKEKDIDIHIAWVTPRRLG